MEIVWRLGQLLSIVVAYIVAAVVLLVLGLILTFIYPLVIAVIFNLLVGFLIVRLAIALLEHMRTKRKRKIGLEAFSTAIGECGASQRIVRGVYQTLWQDVLTARPYPIRPHDSLFETYDVGRPSGMSLPELMQKVGRRCGVPLEPVDWETNTPQTVQGLVRFLVEKEQRRRPGTPATLLRAAIMPGDAECLLRSARNVSTNRPETLLRPVKPDSTDTNDTDVLNEGEDWNYDRNVA